MLGKVMAALGCFGLIASALTVAAGGFMLAMMNDSHLSELGPFGLVVTPVGGLMGLVSLVLMVAGILLARRAPEEV